MSTAAPVVRNEYHTCSRSRLRMPPVPHQFVQLLEQAPWLQKKLMFATDYPHWDFDAPDACLPNTELPAGFEEALMCGNAREVYKLPAGTGVLTHNGR